MISNSKYIRVKLNKRAETSSGDDAISGPKLISASGLQRSDLRAIKREDIQAQQTFLQRPVKGTRQPSFATGRRRPRLGNSKSSAGQVKIFYLPPAQDASIGIALGSPSQQKFPHTFEPSREPPQPPRPQVVGKQQVFEDALRPPARTESVPNLRPRASKWKSFHGIFAKRSTSPSKHAKGGEEPLRDAMPIVSQPPTRFPFPSPNFSSPLSSFPPGSNKEDGDLSPGTQPMPQRPGFVRGKSSSIANPQQIKTFEDQNTNRVMVGMPSSIQEATRDLINMSMKIGQEEHKDEENRGRKDSLVQTPSDDGERSPLPPPKDERFLFTASGLKPRPPKGNEKRGEVRDERKVAVVSKLSQIAPMYVANITDLHSSPTESNESEEKIPVASEQQSPAASEPKISPVLQQESPIASSPMAIRNTETKQHKKEDEDSDDKKGQKDNNNATKSIGSPELWRAPPDAPLINVAIPPCKMERYSVMFSDLLQNERKANLLARRQAQLEKIQALKDSIEEEKKTRVTRKPVPKSIHNQQPQEMFSSANDRESQEPSPSLFPSPLKPARSTRRPKPSPLVRSHTSPGWSTPLTGTFLNTPSTGGAMSSPRSWSDDNVLLMTPASRVSFDGYGFEIIQTAQHAVPVKPQGDELSRQIAHTGAPMTRANIRSGFYTAEVSIARQISLSNSQRQVIVPLISRPYRTTPTLVDLGANKRISDMEDMRGRPDSSTIAV
ncbi:MAG: hypothetical protein M1820_005637 [Bogoriella megaspora]|nr:MAG: hypothetical protein M1820_005637 [Bogoriella megaspora]